MKLKLNKWDRIEIFWIDSMKTSGWRYEDDVENVTKDIYLDHKAIGYFISQNKKQIVICQSKSDDGEEKSNVGDLLTIPRVAIRKIVKI
jgi:hypothetical protein